MAKTRTFYYYRFSKLLVNQSINQSLAGRIALLTLLPFSMSELQSAHLLPESIDQAVLRGCYPARTKECSSRLVSQLYCNIYRTRCEDDQEHSRFICISGFYEIVCRRIGQVLNMASLSNDTGMSEPNH